MQPKFNGVVYRSFYIDRSIIKKLLDVGTITANSFWSSSKDLKVAKIYEDQALFESSNRQSVLMLKIHSKSGRDIEAVSSAPLEREVVFLPGTNFKIVSFLNLKNIYKISLEEF
ncbi:MAG: hypothetical protein AB8E15_12650 [Bdellovibrionales bacterium]